MTGQITFKGGQDSWTADCEVRDVGNRHRHDIQIYTHPHPYLIAMGLDDKVEIIAVSGSIDPDLIGEWYYPSSISMSSAGGGVAVLVHTTPP